MTELDRAFTDMADATDSSSTGGDALVSALISEGVSQVFGVPGIQLDPAVDALYSVQDRIHFTAVRHEQSATYMADGYARTSGKPGVAMVVPGPGMLNATAGLATAYACSTPVLLLVGQIPSTMLGRGHGALHEIPDQTGILRSLTKWTGMAESPDHIPHLVHEAFFHMRSGKPGPVAVELPADILAALTDAEPGAPWPINVPHPSEEITAEAVRLIEGSKYPVICAGGGAMHASTELIRFAERINAPIVLTRESRGCVDSQHPLVLDPLAMRSLRLKADLVIAIGTRLRRSNASPLDIGNAQVISVNADPDDSRSLEATLHLISDSAVGVGALLDGLTQPTCSDWSASALEEVRGDMVRELAAISPQLEYLTAIRSALPDDGILVTEYTQIGYVASVAFPVHAPRSYISPGYQGTLGYGFATALGAQVGAPNRRVVSLNGDGGFSWTLSELSTMNRYRLPCIAIVFNDGFYSNVRRIQRDSYGERYLGTDLENPDYIELARAFGVASHRVSSPDQLQQAMREEMRHSRPVLIEVQVGQFPAPWSLID